MCISDAYEEIKPLSDEEWKIINERCYHAEEHVVPIAVSLHEPDGLLAERLCLSLVHHKNIAVRGNAVLGFGHIARRFGRLHHDRIIKQIVEDALRDSDSYVRGHADSAASDIQFFLHCKLDWPS